MTSLVTGGAGFIGSHVARHCLSAGQRVVVLDDLSGGFRDQIPPGVESVEGSILDAVVVNCLFEKHHFDYVYHLASFPLEGLSHFARTFTYTNNLLGSVNLINASVRYRVKCFVFASSTAVYGTRQPLVDESTPAYPEDPCAISKFATELDLKAAREKFGLNHIIFRPHSVYGEHQNIGDPQRNVIGTFMHQLLRGEPLTIYGDGRQLRGLSHIDQIAPIMARSVDTPAAYNEIINLGPDTPFPVNDLAAAAACAFQVVPHVQQLPARREAPVVHAGNQKERRIFGNSPKVSLNEGVSRMAEWVKTIGDRKYRRFNHIELTKDLSLA